MCTYSGNAAQIFYKLLFFYLDGKRDHTIFINALDIESFVHFHNICVNFSELIQAKRLHALDITTTSFRLIWPRLVSRDTGHYVLEYSPLAYPRQKMQETLPGNQTSLVLNELIPNTTYQVTLYPESNVDYASPQSIQVSTLHGK